MKKHKAVPPRFAKHLILFFLKDDLAEEVQGDLEEKFYVTCARKSHFRASVNYWYQVLHYMRPFAFKNSALLTLIHFGMFETYFKTGWRNILKYKAFSFINIFGLALAMSVCMLIMLMLNDQNSYDQFHKNKDRTFRVLSKIRKSASPNASSPVPLARTMVTDYTVAEAATHLLPGVGGDAVYGQRSVELRGYFADSSFFRVFSFDLENGDVSRALNTPNAMVISSEVASVLFQGEDPVGKRIEFSDRGLKLNRIDFGSEINSTPVDWGGFVISGVLDTKKFKSHLKFDVLLSAASLPALHKEGKVPDFSDNWERYSFGYTYVILMPGKTQEDLNASLKDVVARNYANVEHLKGLRLIPQNLNDITPGIFVGNPSSFQLPVEAYYFLGFLALAIMISACLNYTNLSVARAITRSKEIGVRKVSGAKRTNLMVQFLSESVINAFLALLMAGVLLILLKPAFMKLWVNQYLNFDLQGHGFIYLMFLAFALLIGLIAGIFPAFHLSKYSPVAALKNLGTERRGKLSIRKLLTVSQLVISLFFIVTSLLIAKQFRHFLEFQYGFNSHNIVNIPLQGNNVTVLSNELGSMPGVASISACEFIPATAMTNGTGVRKSGSENDYTSFEHLRVDENFIENLELTIVAGKNLQAYENGDRFILVNETASKRLGFSSASEAVGQILDVSAYSEPMVVIGVIKDFRFQTPVMEDQIGPLLFRNQPEQFNYLNVRVASDDLKSTLAGLEQKWKAVDPVHSFKYQFFDDQLVKVNQWMGDLVSIIGFIGFLAIIIACLGLLGMAMYTTERRTKEVGIRKVLGAADSSIVLLLSRGFLTLLLIAVLVSAPLTYFLNNLWLQTFPNRVEFGPGIMLTGCAILFTLGLLTIGSQTFRATRKNPVDSLKIE